MRTLHEDLPYRDFFSTTGIVSGSYCLDSGMAATEACANDPRGSRVATAYFKKGTVPTEPCNVHVSVEICDDSNMVASPYCTNTHTVSMLNIQREYPYEIAIVDAQYTYLPLPVGYVYPSDSSVPVYQNLLTPGTNPGYSPGVDDPMNHLCIVHYGYTAPQPGDPGYIDPNNPVDPDDPNNPVDPDDPNNPTTPATRQIRTTRTIRKVRTIPAARERRPTPTPRQTRPGRPTRIIREARRARAIPAMGESRRPGKFRQSKRHRGEHRHPGGYRRNRQYRQAPGRVLMQGTTPGNPGAPALNGPGRPRPARVWPRGMGRQEIPLP